MGTELARIGQVQAHLPAPVALLLGLVALAAAAVPAVWGLTRHFNTIVHEGMHATMASALGWKVSAIKLVRTGDGETVAARNTHKSDALLFLFVGYIGPSAFGLLAAKMIQIGHPVAVLWLVLALLVCMLVMVRNVFGILLVVAAGAGLFLVAAYTSVGAQTAVAYAIAWFLLLSGVRVVGQHGATAQDAGKLRDLTLVPRSFWSFLWLVISLGAAGLGAVLLV